MNRIYRSIWNAKAGSFVAVSEHTSASGKKTAGGASVVSATGMPLKALALSLLLAYGFNVYALPQGGQLAGGNATVSTSASSMTVNQTSQTAALNWQSFNIAAGETVRFIQPNSSAIALNRVLGADPSSIFGSLTANGQVFLVNPNGILFSRGAAVNVSGLVASTLDLSVNQFMNGKYNFAGDSKASIVNQGQINASGGYVALLGANVSNEGVIAARLGSVALAGGNAVTLDVASDGLLNVAVDKGAVQALVSNGGMIQADGGQVLMTAHAAGQLLPAVVNNTGVVQAQTIDNRGGVIRLLGDMQNGSVQVSGKLDASAPNGGNGGFIDTSAAQVRIADSARVTTASANGKTGSWLIDPTDYTIAASGGDISGAALSANLANTDITIQSTAGAAGTSGNVNVNDSVTWSANKLTLNAQNNININAQMNGSGTASLALEYGQSAVAAGNTSTVNVNAAVNLPSGNTFSKKLGSDGAVVNYTVINSLGAEGSTTGTDLQGMNGNLAGNYALGSNIDASATSSWNGGAGFMPVGDNTVQFTGNFDGLGHTVNGITINRPSGFRTGMFGATSGPNEIANVGLLGGDVTGWQQVGALVGASVGTAISNAYSTANVTGTYAAVGGLVGYNAGASTITNSWASGTVTGGPSIGGLVGENTASITNSYATGTVSGDSHVGGLVGYNFGTIDTTYAIGTVSGTGSNIGALVGGNNAYANTLNSYWNPDVNGAMPGIDYNNGGLANNTGLTTTQMQTASNFASFNFTATPGARGNNWVMVNVDGSFNNAGGATGATLPMLASEYSATINTAHQLQLMAMNKNADYALGNNIDASATASTGNLWSAGTFIPIGDASNRYYGTFDGNGKTISNLNINLPSTDFVGLIGVLEGTVKNVNLSGGSVAGRNNVGPLVGFAAGQVLNSSAAVNVSGNDSVGGLTGASTGVIADSHASGNVTATGNIVGGLTGYANYYMPNNYATGNVSGGSQTGGLVGHNGANVFNSYATGTVTGTSEVGGLAGYNDGGVSNSYATGATTGSAGNVGGLVGQNMTGISNTYATGAVAGASNVGALVGDNQNSVQGSYFDSSVNGSMAGIGTGNTSGAVGMTAANMQNQANFRSATAANGNVNPNWDYGGTWVQYDGYTTPLLRSFLTPLTVTANNANKTYDAAAYGGGNGVTYSVTPSGNLLGSLGYSGNSQGAVNAGTYTITPSGLYSNQQGYLLTFANGSLTVDPAVVNLSGSRAYDGSTTVAAGALTVGSLVGGETLTLAGSGSMVDKHVGTGKAVSLDTLALADGTGLASNYTLVGGTKTIDIMAANLTLSTSDVTKTYDGNTTATGSAIVTTGTLASGDNISGGSFAYTDKNAGNGNRTVTVGGVTINDGNGGANYNVSYANNTTSTITPAVLTATASAADKTYDGTTSATVNLAITGGLVGSETVGVTGTGTFNSKDVLTANLVTVNSTLLANGSNGGLATNYTLAAGQTATASITPKVLTASATAANKVYDGNTTAAATLAITSGLIGTETVNATGSATFNSKDVLTANLVTVNSTSLIDGANGGKASNYSLAAGQTASASITPKALTASATASNKTYDGNTTAAATLAITSGLIGGESVGASGTATFNTKDVLTANLVTVNTTSLADGANGGLASNYSLAAGQTAAASITPKALTANATAANKTYDGNVTASATLAIASGLVGVETVSASGVATFNSKDVVSANLVTVNSTSLMDGSNGGLASNYSLAPGQSAAASITPRALTASATASNKTYDGNAAASVALTVTGGLVGTETVSANGAATFNSKDVLTANLVTVNNTSLTDGTNGGLASNYSLAAGQTTNALITPKTLTAVAAAADKTYDGNTTASAALTVIGGLVGTETVNAAGTATFNSKDVLTANLVTVNSTSLSDGANGGLASNYTLAAGQTTIAAINPKALTVSGMVTADKTYDGNTVATLNGGTLVGLVGSETLVLTGQTGSFADKNVGTGKTVTVTGTSLANGTGLASNYTVGNPNGLTATIARRTSATWVGGTSGNWFDPANWANGAVPDLANVANVVIPAGVTVTFNGGSIVFPAQAGAVNVDAIGSSGNLAMADGSLNVAGATQLAGFSQSGGSFNSSGNIVVDRFSQSGGTLTTTGNLTVNQTYSQSAVGGSVSVNGDIGITQTTGSAQLGNITAGGSLAVSAVAGNIEQIPATRISVAESSTFSAPNGNVLLAHTGNQLGVASLSGGNITRMQSAITNSATSVSVPGTPVGFATPVVNLASSQDAASGVMGGLSLNIVGQGMNLPPTLQLNERKNELK